MAARIAPVLHVRLNLIGSRTQSSSLPFACVARLPQDLPYQRELDGSSCPLSRRFQGFCFENTDVHSGSCGGSPQSRERPGFKLPIDQVSDPAAEQVIDAERDTASKRDFKPDDRRRIERIGEILLKIKYRWNFIIGLNTCCLYLCKEEPRSV